MVRLALIALTLVSSIELADADCARVGLAPKVLTPADTEVAKDGGIVVGTVGLGDGKLLPGDVAIQRDWRSRKSKPTIKAIAPGLAVYQISDDELLDDRGKSLVKIKRSTAKPVLPPTPTVKAAKHAGKRGGYHEPERVSLELVDPVPKTVVAVVLLDGKTNAPKSFWLVDAKATQTFGFYQRDCTPLPNGTVPSAVGDSVKVVYVDGAGQQSAASAAITITK